MRLTWLCIVAGLLTLSAGISGHLERSEKASLALDTPDLTIDSVDFNAQIRPILARRCFTCHGPDEATREAGLRLDTQAGATALRDGDPAAVIPRMAHASVLIDRVSSDDTDLRMPPPETGDALTANEIDLLRRWIDQGATYAHHWAFVPPETPELPSVSNSTWVRNSIDAFVLARLDQESLEPTDEADRATLIRRVSLDLIGLPPTHAEVQAFLADESPDAYETVVDRLLASPHYGEHWARTWLDLARYADTKGYEADRGRTIWPYRDWVIDALNRDLPYDQFTIEQIAGDLLPNSTRDQRIATAFHRNTMTNDEGGTDDEEFRVAAVVDRVNTTMQTWMGLTMACAQCHTHKYDPFSHEEYYRLFAFFNNTADSDKMDERPTLAVSSAEQESQLAILSEQRTDLIQQIDDVLRETEYKDPGITPETADSVGTPVESVWFDDDVPEGAYSDAAGGLEAYTWVVGEDAETPEQRGPVFSGQRSLKRDAEPGQITQWFFKHASIPLDIHDDTVLFAHVYLDPENPPTQIMMQFHDGANRWEHRVYWGETHVPWGAEGTPSRRRLGDLPALGEWVRLEVKASDVDLDGTSTLTGWAFTQHSGVTYWDAAGVVSQTPLDHSYSTSQTAWEQRITGGRAGDVPEDVSQAIAVDADARSEAQRQTIRHHYLRFIHEATRETFAKLDEELVSVDAAIARVRSSLPSLPIMRELVGEQRRESHILERGSFLSPGRQVDPGVPTSLHPLNAEGSIDRLALAHWLVSRDNSLTARVHANRLWAQLFGLGLVETTEDFGTQGMLPSHPNLLDWLAIEFMDSNWSIKHMCKTIVMSATYRQSSAGSASALQIDPRNRLYSRAPRMRLPAEVIRDQALAVSNLLNPTLHGPPVFPPQPDGVWEVVYNAAQWSTSHGPDRYRRGIYTYWRRTSPYPSMTTFDAPSREFCVSRRIRTNTPLQALVTLNDPVFVEAAQGLARRALRDGGDRLSDRVDSMFTWCVARPPTRREQQAMIELFQSERAHYRIRPDEAMLLASDPIGPLPEGMDPVDVAAWTVVANVIMNLDEFLTRG